MPTLQHRQQKIQEKRKKTPWREFVMEVASWSPMMYYKQQGLISIYPDVSRIGALMSTDDFEEKRNDMMDDLYDDTGSFFSTLQRIYRSLPTPAVRQYYNNSNAAYSDSVASGANIYLSRCSIGVENICYTLVAKRIKDVYNCIKVQKGEGNIYMSASIDNGYNIFYSSCIEDSANIRFSNNLVGCEECICCDDLMQKKYHINNTAYDKEMYFVKKEEILQQKDTFPELHATYTSHAFRNTLCEDVQDVYGGTSVKSGKNGIIVGNFRGVENMYDVMLSGSDDDFYGVVDSGGHSAHVYCSVAVASCTNIFYSVFLESCSYCLGCIGLKNKSFCIFNKQYTKEERHEKVNEIFMQMEKEGILGEFFPGSMNPFYFNDTVAYLIDACPDGSGDSFTKEEIEAKGYLRRDEKIQVDIPEGLEVVKTSELDTYEGWREGTKFLSSRGTQKTRPLECVTHLEKLRLLPKLILHYIIDHFPDRHTMSFPLYDEVFVFRI